MLLHQAVGRDPVVEGCLNSLICTHASKAIRRSSIFACKSARGVRLGYAAMNPQAADLLRPQLPFWNVNGFYCCLTRPNVHAESTRTGSWFESIPSKANFLYVELPIEVPDRKLRDRLLEQYGLMVRECSNKIGSSERYLRLAVRTREAVDLLVQALHREVCR